MASYILSGSRTPIGKFLGGLNSLSAPELAAKAINAAVSRSGVDAKDVQEVILGNVLPAGLGQAPARQAALTVPLPPTGPYRRSVRPPESVRVACVAPLL